MTKEEMMEILRDTKYSKANHEWLLRHAEFLELAEENGKQVIKSKVNGTKIYSDGQSLSYYDTIQGLMAYQPGLTKEEAEEAFLNF